MGNHSSFAISPPNIYSFQLDRETVEPVSILLVTNTYTLAYYYLIGTPHAASTASRHTLLQFPIDRLNSSCSRTPALPPVASWSQPRCQRPSGDSRLCLRLACLRCLWEGTVSMETNSSCKISVKILLLFCLNLFCSIISVKVREKEKLESRKKKKKKGKNCRSTGSHYQEWGSNPCVHTHIGS